MVLIIHGFPNKISALRFEWAWQHPKKSRRLRHFCRKKSDEKMFDYYIRILSSMLSVGPWCRLPLTIRWMNESYIQNFKITSQPPLHMPIVYGRVAIQKPTEVNSKKSSKNASCFKCHSFIKLEDEMTCVNPMCNVACHVVCFSTYFTDINQIIPLEGKCPNCQKLILWGDLVRKKNGCYKKLTEINLDEDINDLYYD